MHVLAAFGFALAHGVSAFAAFRMRAERQGEHVTLLLDLSRWSSGLMYSSLMVLILAGIAAGVLGGWFGQRWIWAAIGVLVAVLVAMLAIASPYYARVRMAVGQPPFGRGPAPEPASAAELAAVLDSRRPHVIALVGVLGLGVLVWLMVFKP
ncbi:MAG TPA: hypothetical protein VOB72_03865 [Candidatus Dormibacteraeota bacterium]|nr:hypothetical protein [Candidatus Dormibacteraeota bacterium]